MNKFYTALVALTAIAMMIPVAAAEGCITESSPEFTSPPGLGPTVGGALYVDNDNCQPVIGDGTCTFSIWVYEESNGIDGLQRDDESQSNVKDCTDGTVGDTMIL